MTDAIAALCKLDEQPLIIAAEGHMITAGDVEFEQPQPKMWRLSDHVIAMIYGDIAAQAEIASRTEMGVIRQGVQDVESIAALYASNVGDYTRRVAEAAVLEPLGMGTESFLNRHQSIHPDLVSQLTRQLQEYAYDTGMQHRLGGAIIAGVDDFGGHIWQVEYGEQVKLDRIGFVAAGSGRRHAESEFMFGGYTPEWDFPDALSLIYSAKKRAEVAPGVGKQTDVVIIFSNPRSVRLFSDESPLVQRLEEIYRESNKKHIQTISEQHSAVREFIKSVFENAHQTADS